MDYQIKPGGSLGGAITVDGDKSVSHRSIMFGSLADGVTRVSKLLEGEDVLATIAAFRKMSVPIEKTEQGYTITGVGIDGLREPESLLDMGNSGTAFRLMTGILAGQSFSSSMGGDASLSGRPMGRVINPLTEMGAKFDAIDEKPPVTVHGSNLHGIDYKMPIASAQVKSALLLAGMYAEGITRVQEPAPTRDHTERMLRGFGYPVQRSENNDGWISIEGGGRLQACNIIVPADLSSATFFILGALISPDSEIQLPGVGVNPSRSGVIPVLQRMGADIVLENAREIGGEPVADLVVRSSTLRGIKIDHHDVALAVDEIPSIAVAAACADGVTTITGAEELRVKESDRIATTVAGLKALGAKVEETADGMVITGGKLQGGIVDSHGDHRIAMAFSMAGNICSSGVTIRDTDCIATSFPAFSDLATSVGLSLTRT